MIDLVIVNWNAGSQLVEAVRSIVRYNNGLISSVIIVDNASSDDSMERINSLANLPFAIQIISNRVNQGFGAACNQGAAIVASEYLLFLNPDTKLFEGSLSIPYSYMKDPNNADVGICGVQLIDESGHITRSCTRFPTPWGFASQAFGLEKIFPSIGHFMAEWKHDSTRDVDHVIGAFYMVRNELFDSLSGFDERFFVYLEDLDFSFRARKAGWRSVYLADVEAFHAGGGTSNQVKARRLFYSLRSRLLYAFKHFSWGGAVLVMLTTLLVEPFSRSALAVARRSWSSFKETWQGYGMLWGWLPLWWFKGVTR
jgi:hypothetical protein